MATVGGRQRYYIIGAETTEELVEEVNAAIADGYTPCGGVTACVYVNPNELSDTPVVVNYFQAMVDHRVSLKIW